MDGKAYEITPKMNFSIPIEIQMDYSNYGNEEIFKTYKFSDEQGVLNSCNKKIVLKSISNVIDSNGGIIDLDGKILMNFSKGSVESEINFTITEYELSDCYSPGKTENMDNVFKISSMEDTLGNLQINDLEKASKDNFSLFMIAIIIIGIIVIIFVIVFAAYKIRNARRF